MMSSCMANPTNLGICYISSEIQSFIATEGCIMFFIQDLWLQIQFSVWWKRDKKYSPEMVVNLFEHKLW